MSSQDYNVRTNFRGEGAGKALWGQFSKNVKAMRIDRVQTQVQRIGFAPAARVCVERRLDFEGDD